MSRLCLLLFWEGTEARKPLKLSSSKLYSLAEQDTWDEKPWRGALEGDRQPGTEMGFLRGEIDVRQAEEDKAHVKGSRAERGALGCRSSSSWTPHHTQHPQGKEGERLLLQPVFPLCPAAVWAVNLQVLALMVTCKKRELALWLRQLSVAFRF